MANRPSLDRLKAKYRARFYRDQDGMLPNLPPVPNAVSVIKDYFSVPDDQSGYSRLSVSADTPVPSSVEKVLSPATPHTRRVERIPSSRVRTNPKMKVAISPSWKEETHPNFKSSDVNAFTDLECENTLLYLQRSKAESPSIPRVCSVTKTKSRPQIYSRNISEEPPSSSSTLQKRLSYGDALLEDKLDVKTSMYKASRRQITHVDSIRDSSDEEMDVAANYVISKDAKYFTTSGDESDQSTSDTFIVEKSPEVAGPASRVSGQKKASTTFKKLDQSPTWSQRINTYAQKELLVARQLETAVLPTMLQGSDRQPLEPHATSTPEAVEDDEFVISDLTDGLNSSADWSMKKFPLRTRPLSKKKVDTKCVTSERRNSSENSAIKSNLKGEKCSRPKKETKAMQSREAGDMKDGKKMVPGHGGDQQLISTGFKEKNLDASTPDTKPLECSKKKPRASELEKLSLPKHWAEGISLDDSRPKRKSVPPSKWWEVSADTTASPAHSDIKRKPKAKSKTPVFRKALNKVNLKPKKGRKQPLKNPTLEPEEQETECLEDVQLMYRSPDRYDSESEASSFASGPVLKKTVPRMQVDHMDPVLTTPVSLPHSPPDSKLTRKRNSTIDCIRRHETIDRTNPMTWTAFSNNIFNAGKLFLRPLEEEMVEDENYDILIFYVISGNVRLKLRGLSHNLTSGDFFFIPPCNTFHLQNVHKETAELVYTKLKPSD